MERGGRERKKTVKRMKKKRKIMRKEKVLEKRKEKRMKKNIYTSDVNSGSIKPISCAEVLDSFSFNGAG